MSAGRGLTLGKYSPFHAGHQLVIETALSEVDELIVLVYDSPETTSIPLDVRAKWIKTLYPSVNVIEASDGPRETGYSAKIMKAHEDYILKTLKIRGITHFYSSEPYGEHMSRALGAVNRSVDLKKREISVTGTMIRKDPLKYRKYLDPVVYRDIIFNVAVLGAPATGKTTLAQRLAGEYGTVWMPEYGRTYWENHQINRRLTIDQLLEIAKGHMELEDEALLKADTFLFTDTTAMTRRVFSLYYHSRVHPELERLADMAQKRYDITLLCADDIAYDDTWDRSGNVMRAKFQSGIIEDLQSRKIPYYEVTGNLEERVEQVKDILKDRTRFR